MKLQALQDPERVRPLLEAEPLRTVRARNLLFRVKPPDLRVSVDDPQQPGVVLLVNDAVYCDLYSPDLALAGPALQDLDLEGQELTFAGVADPLAEQLRQTRTVTWDTPCTLYALADPGDFCDLRSDHPIRSLSSEHVDQVVAAWPLGNSEGFDKRAYLAGRVDSGPTVAVFEHHRPAAFVLTHSDGSLGVLHTEPEHRGRGLARAVLAAQVRTLIERDDPVFGYVIRGNAISAHLLESVGMRAVRDVCWMGAR